MMVESKQIKVILTSDLSKWYKFPSHLSRTVSSPVITSTSSVLLGSFFHWRYRLSKVSQKPPGGGGGGHRFQHRLWRALNGDPGICNFRYRPPGICDTFKRNCTTQRHQRHVLKHLLEKSNVPEFPTPMH